MSESDFAQRMEKLERANRRLKWSMGGLALLMALGVAYVFPRHAARAPLHPSAGALQAREWDLVDASGRVRLQASLDCASGPCTPQLRFFSPDGKALTTLGAGSLALSGQAGEAKLSAADLHFAGAGPDAKDAEAQIGVSATSGGHLWLIGKGRSHFFVNSDLPRVEIGDARGYLMELGASDLKTLNSGQTRQTTAASIVMYSNDQQHHVIWQMP